MLNSRSFFRLFSLRSSISREKSGSTIFALSSGLGRCGVAVIRVSGEEARTAIRKLTNVVELPQPRIATLKNIKHPISNDVIDKGLIYWFPGPKSFTGEDSCEFQVHGGLAVINGVLDALGTLPTFKLAEPGEFTKRAFLNGKLDLTEVEGLADLLQAETEAQRKQAFLQLDGSLSKLYQKWRQILKHSVANIEAHIDFDETETLEYGLIESVTKDIGFLIGEIQKHLDDGRKGEMLRNGVRTVILGQPNVGKSSLLNVICQRPASIVTPISGTTRDVIEVTLNVAGYPLVLSDTAGLRNSSEDIIEMEGMSRARDMYNKADLVVLVVDFMNFFHWHENHQNSNFAQYTREYAVELGIPDLIKDDEKDWKSMFNKDCIVVLNKIDLDVGNLCGNIRNDIVKISCKNEDGIIDLIDELAREMKILCGEPTKEHACMNQQRHRQELKECLKNLHLFLKESQKKDNIDLVIMAEYLRRSLKNVGKLIGTVTTEEILDVIFRDFCIGK